MKRGVSMALMAALMAAHAVPAAAYLKFGVRVTSGDVTLRWKETVRYFVSDRDVPGVSASALQSAAARAFSSVGGRADGVDCVSVWRFDRGASGRR